MEAMVWHRLNLSGMPEYRYLEENHHVFIWKAEHRVDDSWVAYVHRNFYFTTLEEAQKFCELSVLTGAAG